ncbi:MAG: hypothetical protein U0872_06330 [Planctomycetaceae bacterium]
MLRTKNHGGHVTVGGIVYQGDGLPKKYRDQYLFADTLGHQLFWDHIEPRIDRQNVIWRRTRRSPTIPGSLLATSPPALMGPFTFATGTTPAWPTPTPTPTGTAATAASTA